MPDQAKIHEKCISENIEDRREAIRLLGTHFSNLTNKDQAWQDLIRLAQDDDIVVRLEAADVLGSAFSQVPDKNQAWQDLIRLAQDDDIVVRLEAADVLVSAFSQVPDKNQAWQDLHRLTQSNESFMRRRAADVLGSAFSQIPDKNRAWLDLQGLTQDDNSFVRRRAAYALGSAFSQVPDKNRAWQDLHRLTQDENSDVRMYTYHSLGRASVFKATEAEDSGTLKSELEAAVAYFEKSSQEPFSKSFSISPASFCYSFYRTYMAITFQGAKEGEVQKYLASAKEAVRGSESKDELLKAVENLAGALQESQRLKAKSVQEVASELNVYRRYCEKAASHMAAAEDKAPGPVKLMRRCNPLLEDRIQAAIAEIQEKARQINQITRGAGIDYENIGIEINRAAKLLSSEDNRNIQKNVSIIISQLTELCRILPDNTKKLACEAVNGIQRAAEFPDKLDKMKEALAYIVPVVELSPQVKDVIEGIQEVKEDIIDHFDQSQEDTVGAILKALNDDQYQGQQVQDQMKETLDALAELLAQIKKKGALDSDPPMKKGEAC
ncbi:MAG: HEAT repeat domain-containing protein [Methanotrichaceae archaeon]